MDGLSLGYTEMWIETEGKIYWKKGYKRGDNEKYYHMKSFKKDNIQFILEPIFFFSIKIFFFLHLIIKCGKTLRKSLFQ